MRRTVRIVAGVVLAACLAFAGAELALALGSPAASFTFTPTAPVAGQTVSFTNASQVDPAFPGDTLNYVWDFGDTLTSASTNPTHAYTTPGVYTVTLQADEFTFTTPNGTATTTAAVTVAPVTPPANDSWANAFTVSGDFGSTNGRNLGATTEAGEPLSLVQAGVDTGKTVWWKWVAPRTARYKFDTVNSDFDTTLGIFTGSSVAGLTEVASNDESPLANGTSLASFNAVAGATYYVQVGGLDDHFRPVFDGTIQLFWNIDNDAFANAFGLDGDNGSLDQTNLYSTIQTGEPTTVFDPAIVGNTNWFTWSPTVSGTASFSLSGGFNAALGVYTGSVIDGLTSVTSASGATPLTVNFAAVADTIYYIQVGTADAAPGSFTLSRTLTPPNGSLTGLVLDGNGAGVVGVLVRACLTGTCTNTTSGARGAYSFLTLTPGKYVVHALPSGLMLLAAQATPTVTPNGAISGVILRLATSGFVSAPDGPKIFRVNGCTGGSLHYVVKGDNVTLGSGDVDDGAGSTPVDGVYSIDLSALTIGHPTVLEVDSTITCPNSTIESQTGLLFTDPSGTVVDDSAGGAVLAGATVTLLDSNGNAIPSNDPRLSSSTASNPETSDANGAWAWDVTPGTYRVGATKQNCGSTTSGTLTVTANNPAAGVVLHLSCTTSTPTPPGFPPTATPPPSGLPNPTKDSANVIPISGTVLVNGIPLPVAKQVPFGSIIDATHGIVAVTTLGPTGKLQTAYLYGGIFQLLLAPDGVTLFLLVQGDFSVCNTTRTPKKRHVQGVSAVVVTAKTKDSKTVVRALWGTGKGSFRTTGRYSSATVRGTLWYVADRCDGTYTQVNQGVVTVVDLARNTTLTVHTGHSVLVRPK
jgi:PKD repeat protein